MISWADTRVFGQRAVVGQAEVPSPQRTASPAEVSSILREPDVLQLLVRVVVRRGDVVLHLGPVDDVARPPEAGQVVRILEHPRLELENELLPLGGVERTGR